jgi:hypothetical protein
LNIRERKKKEVDPTGQGMEEVLMREETRRGKCRLLGLNITGGE